MPFETKLIISAWIIMIILLIIFVPRNKFRQAYVIFTFKQVMTWILGLTVVELRLIEYPIRSFSYATKSSFDFEYFFYPSFCILFNLYFPEGKSFIRRFLHYMYYCSALTFIEIITEKYTDILEYINWSWYYSFIAFFLTFYFSHQFYRFFFSEKGLIQTLHTSKKSSD